MWRKNFFPRDAASRIREIYKGTERPVSELEKRSGFDRQELDEMKDVFRYFDRDQNKHLDKRELNELFKHQLGSHVQKDNFETVFRRIDANSDGMVSFPEFLSHQANRKKKLPSTDTIHHNFQIFDRNEDGFLNLDEVRHLLLYMGEEAGRLDLRRLFVSVDSDKDGLINKKEFNRLVREHFDRY